MMRTWQKTLDCFFGNVTAIRSLLVAAKWVFTAQA